MGIKFVLARFVVGSHLDPNEQLVAGVKKGRNFLASDEQRPLYWRASSESLVVSFALLLSEEDIIIICASKNVRLLQRTLLALPGLVGVPLEPIVELLLVAVEASLAPPQAVALLTSCQALLHVALRNKYHIEPWWQGSNGHLRRVIEKTISLKIKSKWSESIDWLVIVPHCRSWACPIRPLRRHSSGRRCCGGLARCSQRRAQALRSRSWLRFHHGHSLLQVLRELVSYPTEKYSAAMYY